MWEIEQKRAYLVKLGFDKQRIDEATDAWIEMMVRA